MALVFDIETNGLRDATTVHCMAIFDTSTGRTHTYRPTEIKMGIDKLLTPNETLIGHNIIDYDIPTLERLYGITLSHQHVIDTLVFARLVYSNIKEIDYIKHNVPKGLYGSQGLKAWGYRLGVLKGEYAEEHGEDSWVQFNEEMLSYCVQDVCVTLALYSNLCSMDGYFNDESLGLEMAAQKLMTKMRISGFPFDIRSADMLVFELRQRQKEILDKLEDKVPPIPDKVFIPKRDNKRLGYKRGVPIQRYKKFNAGSRDQIRYIILEHYKFHPTQKDLYNEKEMLKVDENTFKYLRTDESVPDELKELAELFEENLLITKRLGQIVDGKNGWIKLYNTETGCIHGQINPNGTVSGRASHSYPNIAQVPNVGSEYGVECRRLFCVPKAWYQCGVDASGLELRCLSHYLYPFDDGAYAHSVVHGDIHTENQQKAGLETRSQAKTFIYALLYGAGSAKIGKIINGTVKDGVKIRQRFLDNTPALQTLQDTIERALIYPKSYYREPTIWKRKYLKGLDGRRLWVRSLHSALNLLLQSAGAVICKRWVVELDKRLSEMGLVYGWDGDYTFLTWVHDEVQVACKTKEIAEQVATLAAEVMNDVGKIYEFRVQLDVEAKIGSNWAECH